MGDANPDIFVIFYPGACISIWSPQFRRICKRKWIFIFWWSKGFFPIEGVANQIRTRSFCVFSLLSCMKWIRVRWSIFYYVYNILSVPYWGLVFTLVCYCIWLSRKSSWNLFTDDMRHEKTDLKVFVVVIPKEGWARPCAPIHLLVWQRQRP